MSDKEGSGKDKRRRRRNGNKEVQKADHSFLIILETFFLLFRFFRWGKYSVERFLQLLRVV